jgi:hypothetical protein
MRSICRHLISPTELESLMTSAPPAAETGDGAAFSLPPVAVFCDPTTPHPMPCLSPAAHPAVGRLSAALAAVPAFGSPGGRDIALGDAVQAAEELVAVLSAEAEPVDGDTLPTQSPVQGYFRVRTTGLTGPQAALHAAVVVHSGLADLRLAPLAGSDIARETAALRQVIADLTGPEAAPPAADSHHPVAAAPPVPRIEEVWLARWIIGHHVHVLFNVYATVALRNAVSALRTGEIREATAHLDRAIVYVRGFPAARAHAAALPPDFYNTTVRPTMVPTVVPVPLSGSMHVEYQMYRDMINELLQELPEPVNDLALREPDLAFAREALLDADLIEAERHVCLVEPVVGDARSLIQSPKTKENAVSVLRLMRHRRAAQFEPFLRFGDHLVARARD